MTTYNLTYHYHAQSSINTTGTDLEVQHPYAMLNTLLTALTSNQRKNLKSITIVSGISNTHLHGFNMEINLPSFPLYKVTLTTNNSTVTKGDSVTLTVTTLNITTITKVEFFMHNTKLGETTSSPHTYTYVTDKFGKYYLTAKVTDSDGVVTVSDLVSINIQ